jgi:hypothetical protein
MLKQLISYIFIYIVLTPFINITKMETHKKKREKNNKFQKTKIYLLLSFLLVLIFKISIFIFIVCISGCCSPYPMPFQ